MPSRDNHVMMTLKLGRWSNDHALRSFEIEQELASARAPRATRPKRRAKWFSLGSLKLLWTSTA